MYVVECTSDAPASDSRNRTIRDRQHRMEAVDLIGTFILFQQSDLRTAPELFQIFAEATKLHYQAYMAELEQKEKVIDGKRTAIYRCPKDKYQISNATYTDNLNRETLLLENYKQRKDASSVEILCRYRPLGVQDWLMVETDFLTGACSLPGLVRKLQSVPDRWERSVFIGEDIAGNYNDQIPDGPVYRLFFLEEMVTSVPLSKKNEAYRKWLKALDDVHGPMPDLLRYGARLRTARSLASDPVFTEMIEAFPGALSPFGVRTPMDSELYDEAVKAYSQSDFIRAVDLLTAYINENGLSPEALNLLGASLRYIGKPSQGLSYLLLCLKVAPYTPYLAGNIALVLSDLGYPHLREITSELLLLAKDRWSQEELNKLNNHNTSK